MLVDKLADTLVDSGLNDYAPGSVITPADDQLEDELGGSVDYHDDEDELAYVLGLEGGAAMKAIKAMKAMQVMKAMKATKAMKAMKKKAMKVSKIAKGKRSKLVVFTGGKEKTKSGLKKSDLMKNKRGKIVSKKENAAGKKSYKNIAKWVDAVQKARKALGVKGFSAIKKGSPLYNKA